MQVLLLLGLDARIDELLRLDKKAVLQSLHMARALIAVLAGELTRDAL